MNTTLKTKLAKLSNDQLTAIGSKALGTIYARDAQQQRIQSVASARLARVVFVAAEIVARRA